MRTADELAPRVELEASAWRFALRGVLARAGSGRSPGRLRRLGLLVADARAETLPLDFFAPPAAEERAELALARFAVPPELAAEASRGPPERFGLVFPRLTDCPELFVVRALELFDARRPGAEARRGAALG